ncbi:BTB/POZ domain-containing protein 8 [Lamellibrachia satsuma]|nr:BTB/POZ domain-containing protein 8 [Lamellibrachia satsuma]
MIRPRPSPQSSAMTQKCIVEKGKLRQTLKTHLQQDMCRLMELGSQGDVTFVTASSTLKLHKCILKHRGLAVMSSVLAAGCDNHLTLTSADPCIVQQALRSIYSEDNVDIPWCNSVFENINSKGQVTNYDTGHNTVCTDCSAGHNVLSTDNGTGQTALYTDTSDQLENIVSTFDNEGNAPNNQSHLVSSLEGTITHTNGQVTGDAPLLTSQGDVEAFASRCDRSSQGTWTEPGINTNSIAGHLNRQPTELLIEKTDNNNSVDGCGCHGNSLEGAAEPCSQLGEDLLRMYLGGAETDVCLRLTTGETFHAHRCMLSLRSSYFAAMFGGNWRESTATEVTLHGVSPAALHIGLQFIYGGVCELPPQCDISKVLLVSDLYEIDRLKDVIVFKLRRDKCHFFHKPCSVCGVGVAEVLGLAFTYCLMELRDRAVRWCTRYFSRVWSSQCFAGLPDHIHQHCLKAVVAQITNDTVVDTVTDCDTLMGRLSNVNWSRPVVTMATDVMDACVEHLRKNFTEVLETGRFQSMATMMAMGLELLEEVLCRAILSLPTERACATYTAVHRMKLYSETEDCTYTQDFCKLVETLYGRCENYMVTHVNHLIDTVEWKNLLSPEQQNKIRDDACYVCINNRKPLKGPPKLSSSQQCQKLQLSPAGKRLQRKTITNRNKLNTRKSGNSPGTSGNSPGTLQAGNSLDQSQVVNRPGMSHDVNSTGTSQAIDSPGKSQNVSSPGTSHDVNSPGTSYDVNGSGMSQDVNSLGTSHDVNSPGTSQDVNSPRVMRRFWSRNNTEHSVDTNPYLRRRSVVFTESALIPFIRLTYMPAQQL